MGRRAFFSFHYEPDVQRAYVVRNSWAVAGREDAGFLDGSAFERAQRTDDDALKRFLVNAMEGSSVVCVLAGSQTASRRWVRFEIQRAIWDERGLLAVRIGSIAGWDGCGAARGLNPFDLLGIHSEADGRAVKLRFVERDAMTSRWRHSTDFTRVIPKWAYGSLPTPGVHTLSSIFPIYDWAANGRASIGAWIEQAARQARRD